MQAHARPEARQAAPMDREGSKSGFVFSILAHLALLAFFVVGLNWTTQPPAAFEAMIWSELPAPQITAQPKTAKQTQPEPKPREVEPPKPTLKPDIELPKPKVKPKPEPKPEPKETPKPEAKPEPKPKVQPKPETKFDPDLAKKLRAEELARITGGLPATNSQSTGTSRNNLQYADKIRQYIRSRLVFPGAEGLSGNPEAVFEIRQLPNGEIVGVTQKKSSGIPGWDSAVERAIQRSSPLPKADDGSVESVLVVSFRPKDV